MRASGGQKWNCSTGFEDMISRMTATWAPITDHELWHVLFELYKACNKVYASRKKLLAKNCLVLKLFKGWAYSEPISPVCNDVHGLQQSCQTYSVAHWSLMLWGLGHCITLRKKLPNECSNCNFIKCFIILDTCPINIHVWSLKKHKRQWIEY